MRTISAQGSYTVGKEFPDAGTETSFDFEYTVYDTLQEAVSGLGGDKKALAMLNQTHKEDCRNNASGSAKSENGHSTRVALTPEEKEARNTERKADRELLAVLKSKGLSLKDLMSM